MQINANMPQITPNTYARNKNELEPKHNASYIRDNTNTQTNAQNSRAQSTDATSAQETNNAQNTESTKLERTQDEAPKPKIQELEGHKNRITYGLKVLELMSDEEYRAFLWASEGMSETEKMLMAQSLYRFTSFYQGKEKQEELNPQTINAQKAFGIEHSMLQDFIQRYKNAYDKVLQSS